MSINLSEEETNVYENLYRGYLEEIQTLNQDTVEKWNEAMKRVKYEKLQDTIRKVIDAYPKKGIFDKWRESNASLRTCLKTYKAGEKADVVCAQIEQRMEDMTQEHLQISELDKVDTARPYVLITALEEGLVDACNDAKNKITDIKEKYINQAVSKNEENEIFGTLRPLFEVVAGSQEGFYENSLNEYRKLLEFVKEINIAIDAKKSEINPQLTNADVYKLEKDGCPEDVIRKISSKDECELYLSSKAEYELYKKYEELYRRFIEKIQRLNQSTVEKWNEVMKRVGYDKLQELIFEIIDNYLNSYSEKYRLIFNEWKNSDASLQKYLKTCNISERAEKVCTQIEQRMEEMTKEYLKISKPDAVGTVNPPVANVKELEKLADACKDAQKEIANIKRQKQDDIEAKKKESKIFETLLTLFENVARKQEAFYENSLKKYQELIEYVKNTPSPLNANLTIADVGEIKDVNDWSDDVIESFSSMEEYRECRDLKLVEKKINGESVLVKNTPELEELKSVLVRQDIDWTKEDAQNRTNLERIENGEGPINKDGKEVKVYRLGKILVELTEDEKNNSNINGAVVDENIANAYWNDRHKSVIAVKRCEDIIKKAICDEYGDNAKEVEKVGKKVMKLEKKLKNGSVPMSKEDKEKLESELKEVKSKNEVFKEKILKMIKDALKGEKYKGDYLIPSNLQYVAYFPINGKLAKICWPEYYGFNVSDVKPIENSSDLPDRWDRYGTLWGTNFSECCSPRYTFEQRALPYVANEEAYHFGEFNKNNYARKMAVIYGALNVRLYADEKKKQYSKKIEKQRAQLNEILKEEGVEIISKEEFEKIRKRCSINLHSMVMSMNSVIDGLSQYNAKLGLQGTAAKWGDMEGGAKQFTFPLTGNDMEKLNIIIVRR